jgi:hypothetical protein
MGHIHASEADCNSYPQDIGGEPTVYPIASADVLAAAIDGGDMETAARAILAHPRSVLFPKAFLLELGEIVFAGVIPEADAEKRIVSAANVLLKVEGANA